MRSKKRMGLYFVFYVAAALLLLYTVYSAWNCHAYVANLILQKQLQVAGNEYGILSYYMTNVGIYLLYVLALAGIGRILYVSMAGGTTIVQEKKEDASALPKYIETADSKLDGFAIVEPIQKPEQLPAIIQSWLKLYQQPVIEAEAELYNLATVCINIYEELEDALRRRGYEVRINPKEAFSVNVLIDNSYMHLALCALFFGTAVREPNGSKLSIMAEGSKVVFAGCGLTEEQLSRYGTGCLAELEYSEMERAMCYAVIYINSTHGRIETSKNGESSKLSVDLPTAE
ncbi:MAG: hypothetical protein Q4D16_16230 [Eubacteriales bacterium]|nr:hypothetical protein [Eubacteriales bacterium]